MATNGGNKALLLLYRGGYMSGGTRCLKSIYRREVRITSVHSLIDRATAFISARPQLSLHLTRHTLNKYLVYVSRDRRIRC